MVATWVKYVNEKQDDFLTTLIIERYADTDFMKFIFDVIAQFSQDRRRGFVARFLQDNQCFDDFTGLSLEPYSGSWSGSMVPLLQGEIDYFESLLPLLNTVVFLEHKQHIERRIQSLRKTIEDEKKRDFKEDISP